MSSQRGLPDLKHPAVTTQGVLSLRDIDRDRWDALYKLANTDGGLEKVLQDFLTLPYITDRKATFRSLHILHAICLDKQRKFLECIQVYEMLTKYFPADFLIWSLLAHRYYMQETPRKSKARVWCR